MNGCVPSLALIEVLRSTRKWAIISLIKCIVCFEVVVGQQQQQLILQSAEFRLRNDLFRFSFKMVRPVLQPSDVVNVFFDVELKALTEVNNKDQVITTETIITQKWNNPYLRWNPADYDGIQKILVDPNEIWVPDIVLENNADDEVVQAGHLEKFRSWVLLKSDGNNTWLSPATFKSTCTLDVQFFPFDKQRCNMVFRSLTSDSSILNIDTKQIESENPEEDVQSSLEIPATEEIVMEGRNHGVAWSTPNNGIYNTQNSQQDSCVNRADDNVAQAGYTEKFKTWIIIYHNGSSEWISPVSFKSTCVLDVTYFPYDEHRCDMIFGSLTSDKTLMDIETEETRVGKGDDNDVDKQFGMYKINAMALFVKISKYFLQVTRKENLPRGSYHPFIEIHLSFIIRRKPLHFLVFSMVPCMLIGVLILVSFFIPAESGERIGFSCTILLSVSAYLLIVTEALPQQSDALPLIGV
ncbi:neuronal acetylcholine receptor subunit beta-3-like [Orbicella faveolata]|uniref:neuronal acetylcholine receptor subunit beta-3-like n=1 Tax=Orbicella faveolata TaxID=48498 RepID=UPI0009E640A2|nr:neuronal acetylcholine receptor subunit beta-3-like [Orbicella faveolata]